MSTLAHQAIAESWARELVARGPQPSVDVVSDAGPAAVVYVPALLDALTDARRERDQARGELELLLRAPCECAREGAA